MKARISSPAWMLPQLVAVKLMLLTYMLKNNSAITITTNDNEIVFPTLLSIDHQHNSQYFLPPISKMTHRILGLHPRLCLH